MARTKPGNSVHEWATLVLGGCVLCCDACEGAVTNRLFAYSVGASLIITKFQIASAACVELTRTCLSFRVKLHLVAKTLPRAFGEGVVVLIRHSIQSQIDHIGECQTRGYSEFRYLEISYLGI